MKNAQKFKEFIVTVDHREAKGSAWGADAYQHNWITVKSATTGKSTGFDFWGSRVNPTPKTRYDVLNAFYCFVSDAISGSEYNDFPDFCAEFGYEIGQVKQAWAAFKGCKRAFEKFQRMSGYSTDDLYDLCNELSENYA